MNADPLIDIRTEPYQVKKGKYSFIKMRAGNTGNDQIVANSLRVVISAGNNARITSIKPNPFWKKFYLSGEATGNTIGLVNKSGFKPFDLGDKENPDIEIYIKGVKKGAASTITANISYITENNPLLPGNALNASQGNASNTNDNSTTSLTVI